MSVRVPALARRWMGAAVISLPLSVMLPAVGRITPEMRLNKVVFPAPFGPMTPIISPVPTAKPTSWRMRAPPICRPRPSTARAGWAEFFMWSSVTHWKRRAGAGRAAAGREWSSAGLTFLGRGDRLGRNHLDQLRCPRAFLFDELGLVHVLDQRVISCSDGFLALGPVEAEAFQCCDHGVGVGAAFLDGLDDHLAGDEAVRGKQVRLLPGLLDGGNHLLFHLGACGPGEVVVEEADLGRGFAVGAEGCRVAETGDDRGGVEGALLVQGLPHGARGRPGPGNEDHVRFGIDELPGEGGELLAVRDQHGFHGGTLGSEDGVDGGDVALAEGVVLGEDKDLLAGRIDEGSGGRDVLQALATGTEGVFVDALQGIGGGRTGNVENLVLLGLFGEFQGDA